MKIFNSKKWKILQVIVCIVLCTVLLWFMPVNTKSGTSIDTKKDGSITLHYEIKKGSFSLYRIADIAENGKLTLADPFDQYQVEIDDLDSDGWRTLASTLDGYVDLDQLEALRTGDTDAEGNLVWDQLETGVYLILGEQTIIDDVIYMPVPFIVTIPEETEKGTWNYDLEAIPKYNHISIPGPREDSNHYISRKVRKVWKDTDHTSARPDKITVKLLKDGEVYETIDLNEENNWQHIWEKLDENAEWKVVEEDVPDSYVVTSVQEEETFVITNKFVPDNERDVDHPQASDGLSGSSGASNRIPQTGQLWWPVPVLALTGMIAFSIGWIRYRK